MVTDRPKDRQELGFPKAIRSFRRNRPQIYRILVEGRLSPDWADRLAGLRIKTLRGNEAGSSFSMLEGLIADQSQLFGVLNSLHDLRLSLLGVDLVEDDRNPPTDPKVTH